MSIREFFQKTNEWIRFYYYATCFCSFLEEIEDTKKTFRIYLTFNCSPQDLYKMTLSRSRTQQARTGALFNDKDAWSRINFANQQEWKKLAAASFKRELLLCFCFGTSKMNVLKIFVTIIVSIYCEQFFFLCKRFVCSVLE